MQFLRNTSKILRLEIILRKASCFPCGISAPAALYDHVNSSVPFYFGSAMTLIASVMMIGLFRGKPRKNQQPRLPGMHS